jgi:cysteine desulfurase/selenocysteine lyase
VTGRPPYDLAALRQQFPVTGRYAYLDHATFGPPSRACVEAACAALREMSEDARPRWSESTERVRASAARLLGCLPDDLAFVKSSAEAMGLVALGLDWRPGDEVVVYERQFPAGVLPWLNLAHLGVRVRFVRDLGRHRFDAADVEALLGERTRVVCLELVNFGNGFRVPVEEIAAMCRSRGIWLLVDATQAAGVLQVDVSRLGCDLLAAHGYKFLASAYGVAPCYVRRQLRAELRVPEPGWKTRAALGDESLTRYERVDVAREARRFEPSIPDVAAIVGMGASIDLLLGLGQAAAEAWALRLAATAAAALAERGYSVVSSDREGERSALLSVEHPTAEPAELEAALRVGGAVAAVREDRLRLSFHCYNDEADLERALTALARWDGRRAR